MSIQAASTTLCNILLFSPDVALCDGLSATLSGARKTQLTLANASIEDMVDFSQVDDANVIVVDIDANRREHLLAMQRLMIRIAGRCPLIVLTESFNEAVGRWFLQIRVRDFLRKPISPEDLLRTCVKVLRADSPANEKHAQVLTFIPAAGGVGNTTLAVEAAMQMHQSGAATGQTTCLIDLDFDNDACADFLDLEPRLDLREIGARGERLDAQLMEVMLSRHDSGLMLLAAPARPAEPIGIDAGAVGRLLEVAASRFDNLIIDLPRTWFPWTNDVLAGSDKIYVVTDMTVPGLRFARRLSGSIGERLKRASAPRVIVNRYQTGMLFGGTLRKSDVERALGAAFAGHVANNYQVVREAIDRGVSLETVKPGNSVTTDLKRIIFASQAA
jgi:pilus assembly protein CpaE